MESALVVPTILLTCSGVSGDLWIPVLADACGGGVEGRSAILYDVIVLASYRGSLIGVMGRKFLSRTCSECQKSGL